MTALAADRNTPQMDGELISVPVATGVTIYAGALVAANASGYATPGAVASTLTYLGRAEEKVVNAGANGAKNVLVRRKKAFKWANYATDAVTVALIGKSCYIWDDQTVAATSDTGARSIAGKVLAVESDGVWVE